MSTGGLFIDTHLPLPPRSCDDPEAALPEEAGVRGRPRGEGETLAHGALAQEQAHTAAVQLLWVRENTSKHQHTHTHKPSESRPHDCIIDIVSIVTYQHQSHDSLPRTLSRAE